MKRCFFLLLDIIIQKQKTIGILCAPLKNWIVGQKRQFNNQTCHEQSKLINLVIMYFAYFKIFIFIFILVFVFVSHYVVLNRDFESPIDDDNKELKVNEVLQKAKIKFQERFHEQRDRIKIYCNNPPSKKIANAIQWLLSIKYYLTCNFNKRSLVTKAIFSHF